MQEQEDLQATLQSTRDAKDRLSEQFNLAERRANDQHKEILEFKAACQAQVNEIESLRSAYAMKAQEVEKLNADQAAAQEAMQTKDAEIVSYDDDNMKLKVSLSFQCSGRYVLNSFQRHDMCFHARINITTRPFHHC